MKKIITIMIIAATLLTGCSSSVSKDDYDSKVEELEKVQSELTDLKRKTAEDDMSKAGAKAWVAEAFGDNAEVIVNNNDLFVNIPSGYTISEKSIEALWTTVQSALSLYSSYYKENPEQLPYDSVTIIVLEEETRLDMISFQFLKNSDGSFTQNASMVNISDMNTIVPYLNKALKK